MKFLGRQGLGIRGHSESDGNLVQLLKLHRTDNQHLSDWLSRTGHESYLSHDIQNEVLNIMSNAIIRKIISSIRSAIHFAVIADESTDMSGKQQLSISLRWVGTAFDVHEDFIGLYEMDHGADAKNITKMITDVLLRLGLPMSNLRGQGYDGASVMSGSINGVSTQIKAMERRALYIHCCAHSLNLALQDATRSCTLIRDALDFVRELVYFVNASPLRSRVFDEIKASNPDESKSSGLRPLCPTRWTVRTKAIQSILNNYQTLMDTSEMLSARNTDDASAKASGFIKKMNDFETYFGLRTALRIFEPSEVCSKQLQKVNLSVTEAIESALDVVKFAENARTEESFNCMYDACVSEAQSLGLDPPTLPRQQRIPKRLLDGGCQPFNFPDPRSRFRQKYYEFLDMSAQAIRSRYKQEGFMMCIKIENMLKSANASTQYEMCIRVLIVYY